VFILSEDLKKRKKDETAAIPSIINIGIIYLLLGINNKGLLEFSDKEGGSFFPQIGHLKFPFFSVYAISSELNSNLQSGHLICIWFLCIKPILNFNFKT
jgi:hypothetical protein